jgi:hypothetical protein
VLLQLHRGCSMSVVFRGSSCGMLFCLCSIISSQSLPGFHTASIHSCLPRSCCMVNLNCPRYDCVGHSHYQIAKYALKCLHRGSEWQAGGAAVLAEGFIHIQSLKTLVLRSVCWNACNWFFVWWMLLELCISRIGAWLFFSICNRHRHATTPEPLNAN